MDITSVDVFVAKQLDKVMSNAIVKKQPVYETLIFEYAVLTKKYKKINEKYVFDIITMKSWNIIRHLIEMVFRSYHYKYVDTPQLASSVARAIFWLVVEKKSPISHPASFLTILHDFRENTHPLCTIIPTVRYYLMFKEKGLVFQQRRIKSWYQKRKIAVSKIEEWWFEMVNSPYTKVGQKMMQKRAIKFGNRA